MKQSEESFSPLLTHELLSQLATDMDDETVTAIILHGSYARGDAIAPYSDIDLVRLLKETPERRQSKRFIWYKGYLLNLSSRPLSLYREWLTVPQEALFRIATIREAHILLDKEGTFATFQQEALNWRWDPLQEAANAYASQSMVELSETILRMLGALQLQKTVMLTQRILHHVLPTVTRALLIQRGILIRGNHAVQQVQEALGLDSLWTRLYMQAAGVALHGEATTIEARGIAALRLYEETVRLLQPALLPEHWETIKGLLHVVNQRLNEPIT
ncbi:MAG TPA: nucleotidyltransferase domain-containing protein [Ktedonobacteraceae bacterium]|nr:nucleotidyltransferase domain-containing protein [Ktedonobacteraceae bacterium]